MVFLAHKLVLCRKEKGLTQAELASQAGVSTPTIVNLEKGKGTIASLTKFLDTLKVEIRGQNLPVHNFVGSQIKELRQSRSLTQKQLAEKVNTTHPTIIALERDYRGRVSTLDAVFRELRAAIYLAPKGSKTTTTELASKSTNQAWTSPPSLLEAIYSVYKKIDLDPCSPTKIRKVAPVKAKRYYTKQEDGLAQPWFGVVYMNPPYGVEIKKWVQKASREVAKGNARTVIGLVPAKTDTAWWLDSVTAENVKVLFLRGRLYFGGHQKGSGAAPFASALILWGVSKEKYRSLQKAIPNSYFLA